MEAEVLVACGTPECFLPLLMGDVSVHCGWVVLEILIVLHATNHAKFVAGGSRATIGVVLSHTLHAQEVRLRG